MTERTLGEILAEALKGTQRPPIHAAARGDLDALRLLADTALETAKAQTVPAHAMFHMVEAMTFARLAATHDADRSDQLRVVGAFDVAACIAEDMGDNDLAVLFGAQALLFAELMAEDGDDGMADHIASVADQIPASAYREAQRLRSLGLMCPA